MSNLVGMALCVLTDSRESLVRWSGRIDLFAAKEAERASTLLWAAEFHGGNCTASRGRGWASIEMNGGSHRHPSAPGCGELKNRL
jgi:hypothetical protein